MSNYDSHPERVIKEIEEIAEVDPKAALEFSTLALEEYIAEQEYRTKMQYPDGMTDQEKEQFRAW